MEKDFTLVYREQPYQAFHERGLSCAVGTNDAENLAGLQIKINPGQNQRFAIPFGQSMYRKQKREARCHDMMTQLFGTAFWYASSPPSTYFALKPASANCFCTD